MSPPPLRVAAGSGRLRWLHRLGAMDQLVEWIKPEQGAGLDDGRGVRRRCPSGRWCASCGIRSGSLGFGSGG